MHLWKFEDAKMHVIHIICGKYIKYAKVLVIIFSKKTSVCLRTIYKLHVQKYKFT